MKARYLRKLLNNTGYQVANYGEYIAVGSPFCHNLISVHKATLKLTFALDYNHKGRESIGTSSDEAIELTFIWDKLAELIASGEIKDIIEGRDVIENPVLVYAVAVGEIIEEKTDLYDLLPNGILNTTSDGQLLYRNYWFLTKEEAVRDAIDCYRSYLTAKKEQIDQQEQRLQSLNAQLSDLEKWILNLQTSANYPTTSRVGETHQKIDSQKTHFPMKHIMLFTMLFIAQLMPAQIIRPPMSLIDDSFLLDTSYFEISHLRPTKPLATLLAQQKMLLSDTSFLGTSDVLVTSDFEISYSRPISISVANRNYDCIPWEEHTEWAADTVYALSICAHNWVYADYEDVNPRYSMTTAQYCPCGCGGSSNEARICRTCKRSESRQKIWGYTQKEKVSEYKKLMEEKKRGN